MRPIGGRHPLNLNLRRCADARSWPRSAGCSDGQALNVSVCGGGHPLPKSVPAAGANLQSLSRRWGNHVTRQNDLMTTQEAAGYVRLSPRTLERYRVTGEGPKYLKLGRRVLYQRSELDIWLEKKVRRSTSDSGPEEKVRRSQSQRRRSKKAPRSKNSD